MIIKPKTHPQFLCHEPPTETTKVQHFAGHINFSSMLPARQHPSSNVRCDVRITNSNIISSENFHKSTLHESVLYDTPRHHPKGETPLVFNINIDVGILLFAAVSTEIAFRCIFLPCGSLLSRKITLMDEVSVLRIAMF